MARLHGLLSNEKYYIILVMVLFFAAYISS
jgi:hypothetical protein